MLSNRCGDRCGLCCASCELGVIKSVTVTERGTLYTAVHVLRPLRVGTWVGPVRRACGMPHGHGPWRRHSGRARRVRRGRGRGLRVTMTFQYRYRSDEA
eukprot:1236180-Prymnesium_polylepis.1